MRQKGTRSIWSPRNGDANVRAVVGSPASYQGLAGFVRETQGARTEPGAQR